jgi:ATP-dependent DNA helicase RecG
LNIQAITVEDAERILANQESHFWDDKSRLSGGEGIQKIACAFANADGGEFAVGIEDRKAAAGINRWQGFPVQEDGNWIHQSLVKDVNPGVPYHLEWLQIDGHPTRGLVALISISKSPDVHLTSKGDVWIRRGAQSMRIEGQAIVDLQLSKGARSFEDQVLDHYLLSDLIGEPELDSFLANVSPATEPHIFALRERLADRDSRKASVAGAVLFSASPSAVVPRKCAVKVARYETKELVPQRQHLAATPLTIEGPARIQIDETLREVADIIQSVSIMEPDGSMAPARYPPEALKEVIVNAVIHRDYNVSDDILVWVFDNRVEVRSPGGLPGHMTVTNLLTERFARNPKLVRLLNKYPDPPNKDIGEGLNTVVDKMREAKLQQPQFAIEGNSFVVRLGHTPLARPEEIVVEYLDNNAEITNRQARELCGISSENKMKEVFLGLAKAGRIERVPGKGGGSSAWRKSSSAIARLDPG